MSDGFKHPVHIPKIRIRDTRAEDQPEQKEKECEVGYRDIMLEWVFDEAHRFFFAIAVVEAAFLSLWDETWGVILMFLTLGAPSCMLAELPWVSRFLPPMMAKMVKMVGRVIIYIVWFIFSLLVYKRVVEPVIFG